MQNKNPQGNFDPIPDSDQELEKYGVWVKAEPQDLVEEPETDHQPLVIEDATSLETLEELSEEIEELSEMQESDDSGTETFEDLTSFEDGEPFTFEDGSEETESIDASDFEFDEPSTATDDQGFDSLDMELDEALSTDTVSDEDSAFDFDLPEEAGPETDTTMEADELEAMDADLLDIEADLEAPAEDDASDMLPGIEMENIEMDDEPTIHSFDDVGALEADLAAIPASELSSIKEELVSLRSQLGELKREPAGAAADDDGSEEDGTKGGFFDDEDDDTIALTGDELDNILNTADFTVEPPEDLTTPDNLEDADIFSTPGSSEDESASGIDWMEDSQDLLPEDGSYVSDETNEAKTQPETEEPGIEAIEGDESLDLDFEGDDEVSPLEIVPEINVITESPEDTSYLDEDASELSDGFELDASPLEEVPLVEPDLTNLDLDIEIDDAIAAEASEDLPFMESADDDASELVLDEEPESMADQLLPEIQEGPAKDQTDDDDLDSIQELDEADDELVLSIDGDEQPTSSDTTDFTETLDEIEEIEPLSMDPFEDETFSELELHREGSRQPDGTWSSEPAEASELVESTEVLDLETPEAEPEVLEDFESLDFESDGLLGSQEVEDLGGEDLDSLEVIEELAEVEESDSGPMPLDTVLSEDMEPAEALEETDEIPPAAIPEELELQETPDTGEAVPDKLKQDVKSVLLYLDQLLASLPEEKIEEFASSEYYDTYKKLFEDLGLL
jgi:hypothetical protein